MGIEKKKEFIINCLYFAILFMAAFAVLKYGLPMLAPFVSAFVIASLLRRPVFFLSSKLRLRRKAAAVFMVLLFYSTAGLMIALICVSGFSEVKSLIGNLPKIYGNHIEPIFTGIFNGVEQSVMRMDPSLVDALEDLEGQFVQSAGRMVSELSMGAMSAITGFASSLPGLFINLLLMVIATFFIAADYDRLTGFCLRQLGGRTKTVFLQIKEYVVGTLFVCVRSYALIMFLTFLELSVGLRLIGVDNSFAIALFIAVFDILPVLGTGGVMLPWMIVTALLGDSALALGLLAVYLVITVVRNIIEPKIVGSQIGLHPVVTLAGMFVGAQLLGVLGLFGFPIALSLLRHLNDNGTVKLFKMPEDT